MKTGQIIKVLRTNKGIKAKDVYDKVLSRSMYYKYESGLVETTADTFVKILGRLNVNVSEFSHYFNLTADEYSWANKMARKAREAYDKNDHTTLSATLAEVTAQYRDDPSLKLAHQRAFAQASLLKLTTNTTQNTTRFREQLQIPIRYLKRVEHWGVYEYQLLEQFVPLFTPLTIYKLCKQRDFVSDSNNATIEVISSSIAHVITHLMRVQKYKQASEILANYVELEGDPNHFVAIQRCHFFKGVQAILESGMDSVESDGMIMATNAIVKLREVGADDVADSLAMTLSRLLRQAPKFK